MEILLYILLGVVVGLVPTYFILDRRTTALRIESESRAATLELKSADLEKTSALLHDTQLEAKGLMARCESLQRETEMLRQQASTEEALRKEQFQEQLNVVREQFSNMATRVLSNTSEQLKSQNREAMEHITKPISDNFEQLQKTIVESDRESAKTAASLAERLRQVSEQAERMDKTATRLTNALRGNSQQAGNWGETILSELLDSQGFKKGYDYDVQTTLTDADGQQLRNEDTGQTMRPDVVLHYPGNQDVVIDSKVTINDYYEYVNEQNEALRLPLLDRHVAKLRSHYKKLAVKDYSRYVSEPRRAIDFVIMFVPNEAALQVALARDPKLWQEAFDRKVFISGTQNLFAILRMIQIAWRQHRQTENQKKIVGLAEQLLSRIGLFVERTQKVSRDIEVLRADFDDMNKSIDGTRGIVQKAGEMKRLGIKEDLKHPIPRAEEEE